MRSVQMVRLWRGIVTRTVVASAAGWLPGVLGYVVVFVRKLAPDGVATQQSAHVVDLWWS